MDIQTMHALVNQLNSVYKNRGYVTVGDVQQKLDEYSATIIETTKMMSMLEEAGCKITDDFSATGDLSYYDGSLKETSRPVSVRFQDYLNREKLVKISGLKFDILDYEMGLLYYIYLRKMLKLSRMAACKHIIALQEAYDMYLDVGEEKVIFDIQSSAFAAQICDDLRGRKVERRYKAKHKEAVNAIMNYQHFLSQNQHHILANCEALMME